MKKRTLSVSVMVAFTLAILCLSSCSGPKKGRYNVCPAFSHSHPAPSQVMQKNG